MASYDSTMSQFSHNQPSPNNQDEFHGYMSSPQQSSHDPNIMLALSAPAMGNLNATSFEGYTYQQPSSQPNPVASHQMNTSNANNLFYSQPGPITNSTYLDQPLNSRFVSPSQSLAANFSPSTIQETFSPESFGQGAFTPDAQFEPVLERAFADAHLASPQTLTGVEQNAYSPRDFSAAPASNMSMASAHNLYSSALANTVALSPSIHSQSGSHLENPGDYSLNEKPSSLTLNVPQFGNVVYQPTGSPSTTPANDATNDLAVRAHLTSPIVRIEDCEDIPLQPDLTRSLSRRSHGSRRSNIHLSPFAEEEYSEPDWSDHACDNTSQSRHEDGSWALSDGGAGGISPIERQALNSTEIATLGEEEQQRHRATRNAVVQSWLTTSAAGSENEDETDARRRRRRTRPRARSTNDIARLRAQQIGFGYLQVPQPGPGVILNEASDFDDEDLDADDDGSSFVSSGASSSPPADIVSTLSQNDFCAASADPKGRPWTDIEPLTAKSNTEANQPYTANAAIVAFDAKVKEFDTASLAATIGTSDSRRRSISDLESLFSQPGMSRQVTAKELQDNQKGKKGLSDYLNSFRRTPSLSNSRKRKSNASTTNLPPASPTPEIQASPPSMPRRVSNFIGRPRTPKLDTNIPLSAADSRSPIMTAVQKFRNRSKSDIGRARSPVPMGIAQLWSQAGGPPIGALASPLHQVNQYDTTQPQAHITGEDSDEDAEGEAGISMDLSVRMDMNVIPTHDGFEMQIRSLNPHVNPKILERLVQEQTKRYKRLVELGVEHRKKAQMGTCTNGNSCPQQGGHPQILTPKPSGKGADSAPVVFQIVPPGSTLESQELAPDHQAAQFPPGVPIPPVKSLPAKFECPYCFRVKEFKKPSDWTKHIHEDIQPFTCTFPDCTDSKSFKRKADWVRHESEKHRQLESWTCSFHDCTHVCYRRDNFVQHLVREHKVPEPKIRTGRHGGARSPARSPNTPLNFGYGPVYFKNDDDVNDYVSKLVENCRQESTKDACKEPCRFCGNICTSFKKLTVHLAKHMEQIAMPIIPLVEQHPGARDHNRPFTQQPSQMQSNNLLPPHPTHPTVSTTDQSTFFFEEPSEMDSVPGIAINGSLPPQLTYPPPNYGSSQLLDVDPSYASNLMGASYPPAMTPARSRGSSFNEGFVMPRQDTTYPPANMVPRSQMSAAQTQAFLGMDEHNEFGQQAHQFYAGSMQYNNG